MLTSTIVILLIKFYDGYFFLRQEVYAETVILKVFFEEQTKSDYSD